MIAKWTAKDLAQVVTAIAAAVAVILGAVNGFQNSALKTQADKAEIKQEQIHTLVNSTSTKQLQDLKDLQAKNDLLQKLLETLGTKLEQGKPQPVSVVNPPSQPVPTTTNKP